MNPYQQDNFRNMLGSLGGAGPDAFAQQQAAMQSNYQARLAQQQAAFSQLQSMTASSNKEYLEQARRKAETPEQKEARLLREVKERIEREWVTMPASILPLGWEPLGRWEMFKLNVGLMLINYGER